MNCTKSLPYLAKEASIVCLELVSALNGQPWQEQGAFQGSCSPGSPLLAEGKSAKKGAAGSH